MRFDKVNRLTLSNFYDFDQAFHHLLEKIKEVYESLKAITTAIDADIEAIVAAKSPSANGNSRSPLREINARGRLMNVN